jgi:hypothetical protein
LDPFFFFSVNEHQKARNECESSRDYGDDNYNSKTDGPGPPPPLSLLGERGRLACRESMASQPQETDEVSMYIYIYIYTINIYVSVQYVTEIEILSPYCINGTSTVPAERIPVVVY